MLDLGKQALIYIVKSSASRLLIDGAQSGEIALIRLYGTSKLQPSSLKHSLSKNNFRTNPFRNSGFDN